MNGGGSSIASAQRLDTNRLVATVSLLFQAGRRPDALAIRNLAARGGHFSISIDPSQEGDAEEGWMELLANGLTFDLTGLAPYRPSEMPHCVHQFAIGAEFEKLELEAITLVPGPHLTAGGSMFPVVRGLALLAARLAELPEVEAVAWHPARALSGPEYFSRGVTGWVEGGAFPGLGLAALERLPDGSLRSEGLSLFTGQELLLPPEVAGDSAEGAKIALRLLNWLVEHGRIEQSFTFTGPSGEPIGVEPVENSAMLRVWRGSP